MKFNPHMLEVYLVGGTQDVNNNPAAFLDRVKQALKSGITAFQYREKGTSKLTADEKAGIARELRELTREYGVPLLIDDDEELALKVGADGGHVGQKDCWIEEVIQRAHDKLIIGYSCNQVDQVKKANSLSIDYIGSGPVFTTHSKDDADPAIGLVKLKQLVSLSNHPVVAIGGINSTNMVQTLATGVAGLSVISMVLQSRDIGLTVSEMRQPFNLHSSNYVN